MSFWNTATQEQKLAQIDGGIECGMNARQVATNLGTTLGAVGTFARNHGRSFGGRAGHANHGEHARILGVERSKCESLKRNAEIFGGPSENAFSIFDNNSEAFELEWPA